MTTDTTLTDGLGHFGAGVVIALLDYITYAAANPSAERIERKTDCLEAMEAILPFVDLVLYDLKHIDAQRHRRHTGVSNSRVLENLRRLDHCGVPVEIRMPIIPTINDAQVFIETTALFLKPLQSITAVRLLAYHRLSGTKYDRLDRENTLPSVDPPSPAQLKQIAGVLGRQGLNVIVPDED